MAEDWTAIANEVGGALSDFAPGTLIRDGEKTGDAWNPTFGDPPQYPVSVVISRYNERDIDGTRILRNDVLLLVSANGERPRKDDKILVNGKTYDVINVPSIEPAGISVLYKVQARL